MLEFVVGKLKRRFRLVLVLFISGLLVFIAYEYVFNFYTVNRLKENLFFRDGGEEYI